MVAEIAKTKPRARSLLNAHKDINMKILFSANAAQMNGSVLEISFFAENWAHVLHFHARKWMQDHNRIKTYARSSIYSACQWEERQAKKNCVSSARFINSMRTAVIARVWLLIPLIHTCVNHQSGDISASIIKTSERWSMLGPSWNWLHKLLCDSRSHEKIKKEVTAPL